MFSIKNDLEVEINSLERNKKNVKNIDVKKKYIRANIPKEFWNITFNRLIVDDKNKKTIRMVKQYCNRLAVAKNNGFGFFFTGPHGVGKTSLQHIILKKAIMRGYSAFHINLPEIFQYIYLGYKEPKVLVELHNILKKTKFLAIGEVGRDYHRKESNLFARAEFDAIFRYRRSRCLPTSFDSNMTFEELGDTYGESLVSLFKSRIKICKMVGPDYRDKYQKGEWRRKIYG